MSMDIFDDSEFDVSDLLTEDEQIIEGTEPNEDDPIEVEEKDKDEEVIEEEDEDSNKPKEETPKAAPKTETKQTISSILKELKDVLEEEDYIELDEGEELKLETSEDFLTLVDKIKATALKTEQSDWSQEQKEYFEALNKGVPHEEVVKYQQTQQSFNSITDAVLEDEANEELRKKIIKAGYRAQGLDDDDVEKFTESIFNDGADVEKAKKFLTKFKADEAKVFQAKQAETERQLKAQQEEAIKTKKEFKKFVDTIDVLGPDIKVTDQLRRKLYDGMTKPVYTDEQGNTYDVLSNFLREEGYKGRAVLTAMILETGGLKKNLDKLSKKAGAKETISKFDRLFKTDSDSQFTKNDSRSTTEFDQYDDLIAAINI